MIYSILFRIEYNFWYMVNLKFKIKSIDKNFKHYFWFLLTIVFLIMILCWNRKVSYLISFTSHYKNQILMIIYVNTGHWFLFLFFHKYQDNLKLVDRVHDIFGGYEVCRLFDIIRLLQSHLRVFKVKY